MKRLALGLFAALSFGVSAVALSPNEEAMAKIFAELSYADHRCERLELNIEALVLLGAEKKINAEDFQTNGRLRHLAEAHALILKGEHDNTPAKSYCAEIDRKYGPAGNILPGLMTHK